jgi:hypothetical protein
LAAVILHDLVNIAHFWEKSMPYGTAQVLFDMKIMQSWQGG